MNESEKLQKLDALGGDIGKPYALHRTVAYGMKCRACWSEPPRGRFQGEKLRIQGETYVEVRDAWLAHVAEYHTAAETTEDA